MSSKGSWPGICSITITVLLIPMCMLLDALLPLDHFFATLDLSQSPNLKAAITVAQEYSPVISEQRFFWHQLFIVALLAGGIIATIFKSNNKLPINYSIKEHISYVIYHGIYAAIGGFLFYFGIMMCVPERFDLWILVAGLMQLDTSSYIVASSALAGCVIGRWLLKPGASHDNG